MLRRDQLYAYQRKAVDFVKSLPRCAVWADMGLGKTVSGLTAYADLLESFDARRALIVAPLRVARRVWPAEAKTWAHLTGLHVAPIIGDVRARVTALRTPADVHTINRENLAWLEAQFFDGKTQLMRWPWDLVILDESQSFKSQSSLRWKVMNRLADRGVMQRLVEMSGTPSPNGYGDLWSQLYLLDRGKRLGTSERAFLDRWFEPNFAEYGRAELRKGAAEEIRARIADIVLSMKAEDYLDLPPVKTNYIRVQLSAAAMKTYKEMERKFLTEIGGKTLTAVNSGVLYNKLCQLANGTVYVSEGEWLPFHDEKLNVLPEVLEAANGPVMLVYYYKSDLERMVPVIKKTGARAALLQADKAFDAFREGRLDVGVIHPASAGHGLNDLHLSGAETIVHFGLTGNLEWYQQVNARLTGGHRRTGKAVVIHHIIAEGTRDEGLVELLTAKDADQYGLTRALAA